MRKIVMTKKWQLCNALLGLSTILCSHPLTLAQVIPDNTLGAESSRITNIDQLRERIDGGAIRGGNLFHSFLEFNVGEGRGVYFANPTGIENILSRVTGGNASHILGQLGVLGNANLFLLNPNGIIFGQNASLDIQGSFHATTADGIKLGENGFFNAIEPQKSNLLSVDPGVLLFNQAANHSGSIINRGSLAVGGDLNFAAGNLDLQGQLYSGGNLTLKALNTVQLRDTVTNPFVAAAMGDLLIQGNESVDIFVLNHSNSGLFSGGDLVLRSANTVVGDAHYYSVGDFRIEKLDGNLNNLSSPNDPVIRSNGDVFIGAYQGASLHIIAGGSVTIPDFIVITGADPIFGLQETITLANGQEILIDGKNTPTVDIRAGVNSQFIGFPFFQGSGNDFFLPPPFPFLPATSADINIGTIVFSGNPFDPNQKITGDVLLTNQYQPNPNLQGNIILNPSNPFFGFTAIDTSSFSDGGKIIIDSKGNTVVTGAINSFAFGQNGKGGDVFLNSVDDISLISGNIRVTGSQGGNITLNANNIDILTTLLQSGIGQGLGFENAQAGDIQLNANETILIDSSLIANGVLSNALGNAGDTVINTSNLLITNGTQLNSNTLGVGNAGLIKITATGDILIAGESPILGTSGIFSQVQKTGIGDSQGIEINANKLILENGANIDSTTFGRGNAGLIKITANDSINVIGESSLSSDILQSGITSQVSDTGVGNSQGIIINTPNLNLEDGGRIDATTLGKGDAGRIQITAPDGNILLTGESLSGQVSTISSQVQGVNSEGNNGGIVINTSNLILENGAGIDGNTSGIGNAGLIDITANSGIIISGEDKIGSRQSGIFSQVNFFGEEIGRGRGRGNSEGITINTSDLTIQDGGAINANTFAFGNAGKIKIIATDNITISGASLRGFNSSIASQVRGQAEGNSGGIVINTSQLKLENGGAIDASTEAIGNTGLIEINAQEIALTGKSNQGSNSVIGSAVELTGIGNSEGILINSDYLILQDGASITTSSVGSGNAGNITLNINKSVSISGRFFSEVINRNVGGIEAFTQTTGIAGNIFINTPQLTILDGAGIEGFTQGSGNAGNIVIENANSVILGENTNLTVETSDTGRAGDITITSDTITIGQDAQLSATATETATNTEGGGSINLNTQNLNISGELGIFAETQGQSPAGSLTINPNNNNPNLNIRFTDNGFISARTFSAGEGGDIAISAPQTVDIRGEGQITVETSGRGNAGKIDITAQNLTLAEGLEVSASTIGEGNAGNITLNTQQLTLDNNSQISASTSGKGDAGDISINAQTVTLDNNSAITTTVNPNATGQGGNITIITSGNSVTLNNRSEISSRSQGEGDAGNITIDSRGNVTLTNSDITTSSDRASGGEINISANNIRLLEDSDIRTNVNSGAGGGGDINLFANVILAFDDSDILAFARDGRGGNITLNTPIFFGDGFQQISSGINVDNLDGNNRVDVNASGAISGSIIVPDITFIRNSLTELPQNIIDTENLIANSCVVPNRSQAGTFIITGSGGLPVRPGDVSGSTYSTGEVRTLEDNNNQYWQPGDSIVEPQGVYRLPNGKLVLSRECESAK